MNECNGILRKVYQKIWKLFWTMGSFFKYSCYVISVWRYFVMEYVYGILRKVYQKIWKWLWTMELFLNPVVMLPGISVWRYFVMEYVYGILRKVYQKIWKLLWTMGLFFKYSCYVISVWRYFEFWKRII